MSLRQFWITGPSIVSAFLDDEDRGVIIKFSDGSSLMVSDERQSCCEHRYISTDDSLSDLIGKTLACIESRDGPDEIDGHSIDDEVHETAFVDIRTHDGTSVTLVTHNEHNGYYGGFSLQITEIKP